MYVIQSAASPPTASATRNPLLYSPPPGCVPSSRVQHQMEPTNPTTGPRLSYLEGYNGNGNGPVNGSNGSNGLATSRRLSSKTMGLDGPIARTRQRRSSILSDYSVSSAREALLSTTDQVLMGTGEESGTLHSIPLLFAVLPAVGGVLFTGANFFITDILLLFFVTVFLHWLVRFPWEWYHSSQSVRYEREPESFDEDACETPTKEEPDGDEAPPKDETSKVEGSSKDEESCEIPIKIKLSPEEQIREDASKELQFNEIMALVMCFVGPGLGGWLLHQVRSQLSRPSEGLISNFNLTLFVLAAELRPAAQLVKLVRMRCLHLQTVAYHPPASQVDILTSKLEELQSEVRDLTMLTAKAVERDPDLDALNRAVRRYEKKEALHSAQTESRIQEIDNRLNDVLTLAAAASARRNSNTFSMMLVEWLCATIVIPFTLAWAVCSLPAKAVETLTGLKKGQLLLEGENKQPQRKSIKGKPKGMRAK